MSNTVNRIHGKFAPGDRVRRITNTAGFRVGTKPFIIAEVRNDYLVDPFGDGHAPANIEHAPLIAETNLSPAEQDTRALQARVAKDVVNNPSHYQSNGLEAIDVLEAFGLTRDGRLFNVGKYILRAGKKDAELQDLKKARWYLDRLINDLEKAPIK